MKLLYAARRCRFDLLDCVASTIRLARSPNGLRRRTRSCITSRPSGLCASVQTSHDRMMIGWAGECLETASIGLFVEADYAGCGESLRSTHGALLHIQGPHTRFPLAGLSKTQGCLSHSTPEAEIVAADFAMIRLGLPAITLWQQLGISKYG